MVETCKSAIKIGILLGSLRSGGNGRGIERWLLDRFGSSNEYEVVNIYPNAPMHPLGPVDGDVIPALIGGDTTYGNEKVVEWSKVVTSCNGFIILTPQYNWGYPGDLKNVLDHIYSEWKGKPVMTVTYGGHGGEKCDDQLRQVLSGLKMKVIEEKVHITLPSELIRTSARLNPSEYSEESESYLFLKEYKPALLKAVEQFKSTMEK